MNREKNDNLISSAKEKVTKSSTSKKTVQTCSDSYKLSYADQEFLLRDELRPLRLQLELLKPEILLTEHKIFSTNVVFGSTKSKIMRCLNLNMKMQ